MVGVSVKRNLRHPWFLQTGWLSPADQLVFRGLVSCSWLKGTTWNDDFCCFFKELCIGNLKNLLKKTLQRRKKHQKPDLSNTFSGQSIIKNVVRLLSLADVPSRWKSSNSYLGSRSYPCSCSLQYLQVGRWLVRGKGYGLFVCLFNMFFFLRRGKIVFEEFCGRCGLICWSCFFLNLKIILFW